MEERLPTAALTLSQVDALLAVPNVADPLGVRDRAMLELCYSCGLRRSELYCLELTDLNPKRRTLTIRQLQEVHARCHPSATLPIPHNPQKQAFVPPPKE